MHDFLHKEAPMDIRSLTQFLQIAKDGSYTQAAATLYLAQPTLSKTVQNLEQELGVALFHKDGQRVILTEHGEKLVEVATPIVNDFHQIPGWVCRDKDDLHGCVNLAVTPILASVYLVEGISLFSREYPEIELKMYEHGTYDVRNMVLRGECDVGLCMSCEKIDSAHTLDVYPILHEEIVVLIHQDDPLSQQESITMEQLQSRKFNLYTAGHALLNEIYRRCRRAGFSPDVNFYSGNATFLSRLSEMGNGITILPRPFVGTIPLNGLKAIPFSPSFPWECCMITKHGRYRSGTVKRFMSVITAFFQQIDTDALKKVAGRDL